MTRRSFSALAASAGALQIDEQPVSGGWPAARLQTVLLPPGRWRPFPRIQDRSAWEGLSADVRDPVVAEAKAYSGKPWSELPATLFLDFKRTGNRSRYEDASFPRRTRLTALVIAECVEGRGNLLDDIADGIWKICEESFWGIPSSFPNRDGLPDILDPTLELFAGETGALLAWVDYLLNERLDSVSPLIRKRIRLEAERRILLPGLAHDDYGWMGLRSKAPVNNWNPWICSNWLATSLLLDDDAQRRTASVHKIMRCLDRFMAGYAPDGGCDEGPGYWQRAGASLFEALEWLRMASEGAIQFQALPLIGEIGRYIFRAHVAGNWYINFADAPAQAAPPGDLVYRFGQAIADPRMMAFGAWCGRRAFSTRESIGRVLPAVFNRAELQRAHAAAPLLRDAWFPGMQVMAARVREGEAKGLLLAAQGGHNAESHNHNDVGNFIVYADGEPAIIDVGVERYTAKTFSSQRYDIWTMQSGFHNCPTVNGAMQSAGRQFQATEVAYRNADDAAELKLNLAKAYPASAGIRDWTRTIRLDRTRNLVEIFDRYALDAPPSEITLRLMAARKPIVSLGRIELPGRVNILFDEALLNPRVEEIALTDAGLLKTWGGPLYRILFAAVKPGREGRLDVRIVGL